MSLLKFSLETVHEFRVNLDSKVTLILLKRNGGTCNQVLSVKCITSQQNHIRFRGIEINHSGKLNNI